MQVALYHSVKSQTPSVVWAIAHFRYHLYGQRMTVYTDHTAIKAVLSTPNLNGEHVRWWN